MPVILTRELKRLIAEFGLDTVLRAIAEIVEELKRDSYEVQDLSEQQ